MNKILQVIDKSNLGRVIPAVYLCKQVFCNMHVIKTCYKFVIKSYMDLLKRLNKINFTLKNALLSP